MKFGLNIKVKKLFVLSEQFYRWICAILGVCSLNKERKKEELFFGSFYKDIL
jgi:hypothetical protein